jgi:hypothetical protein
MILDFSTSGFKNRYLVTWPEFPVNFFQNIQAALLNCPCDLVFGRRDWKNWLKDKAILGKNN